MQIFLVSEQFGVEFGGFSFNMDVELIRIAHLDEKTIELELLDKTRVK